MVSLIDMPRLTLVLGGASSGKSLYAESLIPKPRSYIATAEAMDDVMRAKIKAHQDQRGPDWATYEAPLNIAAPLTQIPPDHAVLIDCVTLWLGNLLHHKRDIKTATDDLITDLSLSPSPIVVVSNELGQGVMPENPMAREFIALQGQLNQALARVANRVVLVTAGLPQVLK